MNEPKKETNWTNIQGAYLAGVKSVNSIANEYGISEGAIRKRAKKEGWSRDPEQTKRQMVRTAMSGGTNGGTNIALRTIEDAAAEDIADMQRSLRINRLCLVNLEAAAEVTIAPREIKVIVEATAAAVASIRVIRGLDDGATATPVDKDIADLTDEEFYAELFRLGIDPEKQGNRIYPA
ncbi:MAG: hypothetical protein LBJ59_02390 [Zoogloeaceae bacterium]|jgi:hypothetical protein|nr:hypothetical protein [Zoogloeaceae bacterium]